MGTPRLPGCFAAWACLSLFAAAAHAEPGDAAAVAQARRDYAQAMKGHDIGVQSAMRAELAAQLAMAKKLAKPRASSTGGRQPPQAR